MYIKIIEIRVVMKNYDCLKWEWNWVKTCGHGVAIFLPRSGNLPSTKWQAPESGKFPSTAWLTPRSGKLSSIEWKLGRPKPMIFRVFKIFNGKDSCFMAFF